MSGALVDAILGRVRAAIEAANSVECPHCGRRIDMTDSDRVMHHVTYWGEEGRPVAETCPHCEGDLLIEEHVSRYWTGAPTPEAKEDEK